MKSIVLSGSRTADIRLLSGEFDRVVLDKKPEFSNLNWLLDYREKIKSIRISGSNWDVKSVEKLMFLDSLDIQDADAPGFDFSNLKNLQELRINVSKDNDINWHSLSGLRFLNINKLAFKNIHMLAPLVALKGLRISNCKSLESVISFESLKSLQVLHIYGAPNVVELNASNLAYLDCENMKRLKSVGTNFAGLRYLRFINCPEFIFNENMLNSQIVGFRYGGSGDIPALAPFKRIDNLRELAIGDGSKILAKDFDVLNSLDHVKLIKVGKFSKIPSSYDQLYDDVYFDEIREIVRRCF